MSEDKNNSTPTLEKPSTRDHNGSPLREFGSNFVSTPREFRDSIVRHGKPTSDRAKSQTIMSNFFLHILPVRVHVHSLKAATTLGLGVATFVLFVILCFTGVLLMVYYKPAVDQAYG